MSKCKIISALKIEMLGANLFFKQPVRSAVYTGQDMMRDRELRMVRDKYSHNNDSVRHFEGHPRFGFQTLLNTHSATPLPTAPAIVGGNVDWTKSKVTPITHYLHSALSEGRPMNPPPALGSLLRLGEPNINSIHTTY